MAEQELEQDKLVTVNVASLMIHDGVAYGRGEYDVAEDVALALVSRGAKRLKVDAAAAKEEDGKAGEQPAPNARPKTGPLPEDFPGRDKLALAKLTSYEDIAGKSLEDLTTLVGGKATAAKIIEARDAPQQ
jgi:hypothetical protein